MASISTSKSKIVHLETATIRMSGAVSDGSDSDTETPSDSEPETAEATALPNRARKLHHTKNGRIPNKEGAADDTSESVKTRETCSPQTPSGNHDVNTHNQQSGTAQDTDPADGIAQVMVDSSDSGCPCSPMEETSSNPHEETSSQVREDRLLSCIAAEQSDGQDSDKYKVSSDSQVNTCTVNSNIPTQQPHSDSEQNCLEKDGECVSTGEEKDVANEQNENEQNENSPSGKCTPTSPTRYNPFNKEDEDELDPFPQLNRSCTRTGSSDSWTEDEVTKKVTPNNGISNMELGITEDYFSQPEGHFGVFTIEELELAIANCCRMITEIGTESENKKELVHKLVQLRLKLAEAKDDEVIPDTNTKQVVGHMFQVKDTQRSRRYCEHCNTLIWGVLQNWYRCEKCGFCCHEKCLDLVGRTCASVKIKESPEYILSVCPEKSLPSQNYKCAECRTPISFHSSQGEPRLCDYTGSFYCARCHWNDLMIIPARILHNWDFEPRKVCRGTKQYLKLMKSKPVIRVQDINPMLFNFVEEMNEVKKLREEILIMKKYFLSCREALQSKLLLQLQERQHFVEKSDMYSVQDLHDVVQDVLLAELAKIHASFAQHIKTDCQLCRAKGYHCELCDEQEVLFPFDNIAIVCSQCSTVLHRHCYMRRNQKCPKCIRRNSRVE